MAIWASVILAFVIPVALAFRSPLLAWRDPIYIIAGAAGVLALGLLMVQPLLAAGVLPGLPQRPGRRVHRWMGALILALVLLHVGGLWVTSPPDVIDALLFRSPTPFSAWGVVAMWAVFASALLAVFRRRWRPHRWRKWHGAFGLFIVAGSVLHALQIEGTMEQMSKVALCGAVLWATAISLRRVKLFPFGRRNWRSSGKAPD